MKPEPFLDSNLCVVKDDYSGDTAEMLKCTDQGILKAFDRLQCFSDFCIPAQFSRSQFDKQKAPTFVEAFKFYTLIFATSFASLSGTATVPPKM